MKKRRILSLVTAACLAFSLTSCGSTSDDAAADSGDASEDGGTAVITLGMIGPLTGSLAVYGTHNQRGVELAIEEINAAGGVTLSDGTYQLAADIRDDQGDTTECVNAMNALISDGIQLVIGSATSGCTSAITSIANSEGVVLITPSGTADSLTTSMGYVFRTCFRDSFQGELAAQYAAALGELADLCGELDYRIAPETLARFPDVLTVTKEDEDLETVSADLCAVLDEALSAYNAMRAVEGAKLAEDIAGRLDTIERCTGQVEQRSPETVAEYRQKLTARMEEVLQSTTIDEQRILMEAAIYADKVAVDEETVRLRSHVAQLRTMLQSDEPMGRKMDFLIQEVNRESNTIGSKCSDVAIAEIVVALKAEVEKMREQVQNVE